MLRLRVAAVACLAVLSSTAVRAEAVRSRQEASSAASPASSAAAASEPAQKPVIINRDPSLSENPTADDSKPHIAAAAASATESTGSEAPSKPAEAPVKAVDLAKPVAPPPPTLTAQIDLGSQTMAVAEDGVRKYSWPISSGTAEFPTPRGTFHPQWVAKMWYSRKYDNAPMPNAVFINGGVAVHATQHVSSLGRAASHGCIRLAPGNAKIFYGLVQKHGLKLTRVSIFGNPKWNAPAVASRDQPSRRRVAAAQDNESWFWSPKKYQPVSAYDQGFAQRRYRQVPPRRYYYQEPQQRAYDRRYNDNRVVYMQRPQRRVYYYNSSGYGYGGGW